MKNFEEFKTMEELLQYKKELETIITDEDLLEEIADNIWNELVTVNKYVSDILNVKNTNRKWLSILLTILNSRSYKNQYKIKVINDSSRKKKIYTIDDSLSHIAIEEDDIDKEYNVVLFTNDKDNNDTILYDEFVGNFNLDIYLDQETSFSKITDSLDNKGLNEKEMRILNKYVFDRFKEEKEVGLTKVRKRD